MKGFSNPLVFDEKELRRSNILNEMLHGQYEDVLRQCFEKQRLRPLSVRFDRVWLCLTGMKRPPQLSCSGSSGVPRSSQATVGVSPILITPPRCVAK